MPKSVFIAMPMGDGKAFHTTVSSLVNLSAELTGQGWDFSFAVLPGSSLIDQARNILLDSFMKSRAENLLWIDSDVGFNEKDAIKLLECSEKVVGGAYPKKKFPEGYPIRPVEPRNRKNHLVEVMYLPGGFVRFKRSVLEDIIERYGDSVRCEYDFGDKKMDVHHLYQCGIGESGGYCGEDVSIMNAIRSAGYKVWVDPSIKLTHTGFHTWHGDYAQYLEANNV